MWVEVDRELRWAVKNDVLYKIFKKWLLKIAGFWVLDTQNCEEKT